MKLRFLCTHLIVFCALVSARADAQIAGNLDAGFDPNVGLQSASMFTGDIFAGNTSAVTTMAVQPDGKTIVGGNFVAVGGTTCNGLARLNADGTVDATFVPGLETGSLVSALVLLQNGKMLVSNSRPTTSGLVQTISSLDRLNADGSVDPTFTRPLYTVGAMAVQPDSKVLLAATSAYGANYFPPQYSSIITINNPLSTYYSLIRLDADGSVDYSFSGFLANSSFPLPAGHPVSGMAVQADGKIVVQGNFESWLGTPRKNIARLNANGSLDMSFDPGTSLWGGNSMSVARAAVQGDGKILLTGTFPQPNATAPVKIVRLNADGTLDGTFNAGTDADSYPFTVLAVQVDGKIVVGGSFSSVNGETRMKLARLNGDGSLESTATFDAGSGVSGGSFSLIFSGGLAPTDQTKPNALAFQADGGILLGGAFTKVNGQTRNKVARLLNDPASQTLTIVDDATRVQWQRGGSAPETAQAVFQLSRDGGLSWTTLGNGTREPGGWQLAGLSLPSAGAVRAIGVPTGGNGFIGQTQSFSGLPISTITAIAAPAANGSVAGDGNKATGSTVTLVATPAAGCDFTGWTENGTTVSTVARFAFTANTDRTLVANFTRRSYMITSAASASAGGVTQGGGLFSHGAQGSLSAVPAAGYRFVNWTENGNVLSTYNGLFFTAVASRVLVANFAPNTYTVSASSDSSSKGSVNGGGSYTHGARIALVSTPAAGYKFAGWSEAGTVINWGSTLTFTASANRTLTASFTPIIYTFNGGASYNAGTNTYSGASLTLGGSYSGFSTSIINGGLIYGGIGGIGGITPVTYYNVSASAIPAGGGSTVGGGASVAGTSATALATPAAGFTFVNWTENGTVVSSAASYTFTPSANRTLVANFSGSNNADLTDLLSDQAKLTPLFDRTVTSYSARVPTGTDKFNLMPALAQDGATFTVNGIAASTGGSNPAIALNVGSNTITLIVTAPDRVATRSYTVSIFRGNFPHDLNGDGSADLVFQNNSGQVAAWYLDAKGAPIFSSLLSSGTLGDWKVKGLADMNDDGHADILFQNNLGQIAVWYRDAGGAVTSSAYLSTSALGDWKVVGAADMNGDGHADLLFQNDVGQIAVWDLDGSGVVVSAAYLSTSALGDWRVVGIADVNSDGHADLLFQNNAGQIAGWYLDSSGTVASAVSLNSSALGDWRVVSVADLNGDGHADLCFQNNVGQIAAWYLDGSGAVIFSQYLYSGGLGDWRVR